MAKSERASRKQKRSRLPALYPNHAIDSSTPPRTTILTDPTRPSSSFFCFQAFAGAAGQVGKPPSVTWPAAQKKEELLVRRENDEPREKKSQTIRPPSKGNKLSISSMYQPIDATDAFSQGFGYVIAGPPPLPQSFFQFPRSLPQTRDDESDGSSHRIAHTLTACCRCRQVSAPPSSLISVSSFSSSFFAALPFFTPLPTTRPAPFLLPATRLGANNTIASPPPPLRTLFSPLHFASLED